jgi:hypothetical protein
MKVENMVKLKEEFDYKSLCRRLDIELDKLIAENERQRKFFDDEIERIKTEAQCRIAEAERVCKITLEVCFLPLIFLYLCQFFLLIYEPLHFYLICQCCVLFLS